MSFLKPARAAEVTLIQPTEEHITVAGSNAPTRVVKPLLPKMNYTPSVIRAHLASEPLTKVVSYTEIVPIPVGLTGQVRTDQIEAARELADYASDLCAPIECLRTADGKYESNTAFRGDTSIETLAQNLKDYNLCLKTTVSSDSPHFTPSSFRIDADDLNHLCANASGLEHDGSVSKFIKATTEGNPHNILFHALKSDDGTHAFYGISYVEKTSF